jgi:hypothetical protein
MIQNLEERTPSAELRTPGATLIRGPDVRRFQEAAMKRTAAALLALTVGVVAPAHAELKIAARTSLKAAKPPAQPAPPTYAMFGEMTLQLIVPAGPVDVTAIVGAKGARIEYAQPSQGMPAGTVILVQPNGDIIAMNPKERTFWKTTAEQAAAMWRQLGIEPIITHKRTGEFATIAGLRAERIAFEWSMALPLPPEEKSALPPNAPAAMTMSGDLWVAADRYKEYAPMAVRTNSGLAAFGMIKLLEEGIVLRSVLRSPSFGEQEIETIVTSISEEPAPASTFEIPAGYKQVPPPGGGLEARGSPPEPRYTYLSYLSYPTYLSYPSYP